MNQELGFETIPFEIAPEFQGGISEEEGELGGRRSFAGGGSRSSRPRSGSGLRSRGATRRPIPKPRPRPRGPHVPWGVVREPYGLVGEPYPGQPEPSGSERARWVQDCLNQAMGLQLPVTGVMGPETRSAVRSFQRKQGLRVSGIVSPKTEQALTSACEAGRHPEPPAEELEDWGVLPSNGELDQEFVLQQTCKITYGYVQQNIPVLEKGKLVVNPMLPTTRGVYVVKIKKGETQTPHYVGVATSRYGVKKRFNERVKALTDLGIDLRQLQDTRVDVVQVTGSTPCKVHRRPQNTMGAGSPVASNADLLLLEQFLIKTLGTRTRGRGNITREGVVPKGGDTRITATLTGPLGGGTLP